MKKLMAIIISAMMLNGTIASACPACVGADEMSLEVASASNSFVIDNEVDGDEDRADQIAEKAEQVIAQMYADGVETDIQKALWLYNYLLLNVEYDWDLEKYWIDNTLLDGIVVCMGYADTYKYLANMSGLNCETVDSTVDNHRWAIVEIDGLWYHVDPTYDDPRPDLIGKTHYKYFLVSDEYLEDMGGHRDWHISSDGEIGETGNKYDHAVWEYIFTPITFIGDMGYAIQRQVIDGEDVGVLKTFDKDLNLIDDQAYVFDIYWYTRDNHVSKTTAWYGGLSKYGDKLIFNREYDIVEFDPITQEMNVIYEYKSVYDEKIKPIFGSYRNGDYLYFVEAGIASAGYYSGNDKSTIKRISLSGAEYEYEGILEDTGSTADGMQFRVINNTDGVLKGTCIVAFKDEDGVLVDTQTAEVSLGALNGAYVDCEIPGSEIPNKAVKADIMFIKDFENVKVFSQKLEVVLE